MIGGRQLVPLINDLFVALSLSLSLIENWVYVLHICVALTIRSSFGKKDSLLPESLFVRPNPIASCFWGRE